MTKSRVQTQEDGGNGWSDPPAQGDEPTALAYSYGGGVQSNAMLVLVVRGELEPGPFLFANTGDDSEHPATLRYVREVAMPYAAANGLVIHELHRVRRDGATETLRQRIAAGSRGIPIRRSKDGPPMSRSCTTDFKVRVIARWLREHGATKEQPARVALGISVDEIERAKPGIDPRDGRQNRVYPLLDLGLHRNDCRRIIETAGLPVPPKSACWFCPFHDTEAWRKLKRETPDLFAAACDMEAEMTAGANDGRPVFLTRHGAPLAAVVDDQQQLDGLNDCDSGWCMT